MTNELTVRVEHPELPAIRWNEAEVQQNLTEMLAPTPAASTPRRPSRMPRPTAPP